MVPKTKIELKVIELSYCHHSMSTKQSILELNLKPPLYNLIIFTAIITKTIKFVASVFILYQNINK